MAWPNDLRNRIEKPLKIVIFGIGAMGSVYAARFAQAGHEVIGVDPWQRHVEAINTDGLKIEGPDGIRIVTGIQATTTPEAAHGAELVIIATKASGVAGAARAAQPFVTADATVLTIQNGLGAADRIARHLPGKAVLLGVADGFGASMQGPGHVRHAAMKLIRLGEASGGLSSRLSKIAALWREAGFTCRAFDDIHQLIWEKLLCNVTLSAPCTIHDCTVGALMTAPADWAEALDCAREAHACGRAIGIHFSFDDPVAYVTAFAEMLQDASPSMRLDHLARRRSEIDFINGAIPPIGERYGIATPANTRMSTLVRERERAFEEGSS